ncbi:DUF4402 domain-containing protein [Spiribacter roseus]|uniref:DUF4402 domain-containing protein n=1 Tax=Spiribacter roseus TaxID=1855875 RepID=A0ABV3S123_9GAMM
MIITRISPAQWLGRVISGVLMWELALASVVYAESGQGTLEVSAGLSAALQLSCSKPLTFGVWFLTPGSREGGTTEIEISPGVPGGSPVTNKRSGSGSSGFPGPGQGECTVSGSLADDDTELSVTFGTASIDLQPEAVLFQGLPSSDGGLSVKNFTIRPAASGSTFPALNSNPKLTNGEATFAVGGHLVIPGNLTSDQFGGYTGTVTLTVTDNL